MNTHGYYRMAAVVPQVKVADVAANTTEMVLAMKDAVQGGAQVVLFPELCLTGASCGDLFLQPVLQQHALRGLEQFAAECAGLDVPAVVSLPLAVGDSLFNVAAVVRAGKVLGLVPKSILADKRANDECRRFSPAADLSVTESDLGALGVVPIGTDLIFTDGKALSFGIEIGSEAEAVLSPGTRLALAGARVLLNPAYHLELAGMSAYRRDMLAQRSARCQAVCVCACAGAGESTQDGVCAGAALVAAQGRLLAENTHFSRTTTITYADVDVARVGAERMNDSNFAVAALPAEWRRVRRISMAPIPGACDLRYARLTARPFVPAEEIFDQRCEEILSIQTAALVKRMQHTHAKTMVIGISGGLDSTLALIVCVRACRELGLPASTILAVTMPGFGTTGRTYKNAVRMIQLMGATFKEVDIKEACLLHFRDLDADPSLRTNTYENVQARERTKLLMNLSNKTGGLVIGTGDLSEVALGWSTYNGDHMSMYGLNCSVPKTLIRSLIVYAAAHCGNDELAEVLLDVNATPVSPELLPPAEDGTMEQKTEDIIGPYDLHDFFLYHFIRYGAEPAKLRELALHAFAGEFSEALIDKTLGTFIHRFFTQQFKRSCVPDGPKVGTIALSPRGDWHMPSDACATVWKS